MTNSSPSEKKAIFIQDLTISASGKILLEKANLAISPGELVILVGSSGSGKSVLLKLLSGLIHPSTPEFKIQGKVEIFGSDLFRKRRSLRKKIGIVFQEYGLFDEFSPLQNIQFAMDHSSYRWRKQEKKEFLEKTVKDLGIDFQTPIAHYSGGQKKRLSLARTLAYRPEVIIYDEPTAGLDPYNSKNVAALIQKTHQDYKKTTLVVTHDYHYLSPIADRVIYFDSHQKQLREVHPQEIFQMMEEQEPHLEEAPRKSLLKKATEKIGGMVSSFLGGTTQIFFTCLSFFLYLLPLWKRPKWGLKYSAYYFRLISFLSAILYISLAGAIVGFVVTYFTFQFLPYRTYNEPLLIDDILAALGFALYRIFIPIIATVLIAARGSAAVTADLGNRVYTKQLEAMQSLGASPDYYLYTNILYSFLIGVPLLNFIAFFVAQVFSLAVFIFTHPGYSPYFWDTNFHYLLRENAGFFYVGTGWVIAKTLACGALLSILTYYIGTKPKNSGRDISKDITRAIIWGTVGVLIIHFIFAFFEFEGISPQ